MPFNGSGSFSIINTFVPNTTILSAAVNQNFSDIATGLSDVLTRDGQAGMTAQFKAITGTLAAPGISFTSDPTAGLYLPSVGLVGLVAHSLGITLNTMVYQAQSVTPQAGGSGYVVGDTIVLTGGTAISPAVLTVATLSGSAVATATVTVPGIYTAKPTNPVAQGSTSGIGSGATFNVTWNDPTSNDYRAVVTTESGALPWQRFGSSAYMSTLMDSPNGLQLATRIGAANLAAAVSTAIPLPVPGGYLTLTSGIPIITGDVIAATTVYYTPYQNNWAVIHNGSALTPYQFSSQFQLVLTASQAASNIYDVFLAYNNGTPVIGTGPTWSASGGSVTAGSCARGTGAGSTALTRLNGVNVNANSMSLIYNTGSGNTTITVSANQGIYLGSIFMDSVAGQVTCHRSYGQSRKWGVWNTYNRQPCYLKGGDSTSNWNVGVISLRPANNNTANSLATFSGLAENIYSLSYSDLGGNNTGGATVGQQSVGIGYNSTTSTSGLRGAFAVAQNAYEFTASFIAPPALGVNVVTALETTSVGGIVFQFQGTESSMLLSALWNV